MELTKLQKHSILLPILLVLAFAFLLSGCVGARKVSKSETKISQSARSESTKTDSTKTVTLTDTNIKIVDSSSEEEIAIQPLDSSKEMVVSGKSYFNVKLSHKKRRANKVLEKSNKLAKTEQKAVKEVAKAESSKVVEQQIKNTERKSGFPWWIVILIAVAGILYFGYRKAKGLPLV